MIENTDQYLEPKMSQDFIPKLYIGKFSKYFKDDDEKYDPVNIKSIQNPSNIIYNFWSIEPFINTKLHMMNIRFSKKIEFNSKTSPVLQKLNNRILNKSEFIMNIKNIEIKSTDSIYHIFKIIY